MTAISEYEAERWRQLSDELTGQVERLKNSGLLQTREEWQAVGLVGDAARYLFSAFGAIMREKA